VKNQTRDCKEGGSMKEVSIALPGVKRYGKPPLGGLGVKTSGEN